MKTSIMERGEEQPSQDIANVTSEIHDGQALADIGGEDDEQSTAEADEATLEDNPETTPAHAVSLGKTGVAAARISDTAPKPNWTRKARRAPKINAGDRDSSLTDPTQALIDNATAAGYDLLTTAEEVDLAQKIEHGDLAAKDRMINSNLRLVVSQALRYRNLGLPLDDLVQEGTLGLIRAVEKFDWRKGFKFSTYGTLWIRQSLQRGLINTGRTIRLPANVEQDLRQIERAKRALAEEDIHDPDPHQIAEKILSKSETGKTLSTDRIAKLEEDPRHKVTSLDTPVGEENDATLGALIPDERVDVVAEVEANEREAVLAEALGNLTGNEREVVELVFGLKDGREQSLTGAARKLGVSVVTARKRYDKALAKMADDERVRAIHHDLAA